MITPTEPGPAEAPAAPQMSEEDFNNRSLELYSGLDQLDSKLSPDAKSQLNDSLNGSENPKEDKAAALNLAWVAHATGRDPEELSNSWPAVRDEMASSISGRFTSAASDTDLYGIIGQHLEKQKAGRDMMGKTYQHMAESAANGETDWMKAYQAVQPEMMQHEGYDPNQADQYRIAAKAYFQHATPKMAVMAPVVQAVTDYFKARADEPSLDEEAPDYEAKKGQIDAMRTDALSKLSSLSPDDREAALHYAGLGAAKLTSSANNGVAESIERGTENMARSAGRTLRTLGGGVVNAMRAGAMMKPLDFSRAGASDDLQARMDQMYQQVANPIHHDNLYQKIAYSGAEMLPQIAPMAVNPIAGYSLLTASMTDNATQAYMAKGIPKDKAQAMGAATGLIQAAAMHFMGGMLVGKVPGAQAALGRIFQGETQGFMQLAGKATVIGAVGTVDTNLAQAAVDATPTAIQSIAHQVDSSIPEVNAKEAWQQFKGSRFETFLTLAPLSLVGSGQFALTESAQMRALLKHPDIGPALGIPEETMKRAANAPSATEAADIIQHATEQTKESPLVPEAEQQAAKARLDAAHETQGKDYQYTVFDPSMTDKEGNRVVQIDDLRGGGDGRESGSLDSFRENGVDLPDIPKDLPAGRYTLAEIRSKLGEQSAKAEQQPDGSFTVTDSEGKVIDRANDAQQAAALVQEHNEGPALPNATQSTGAEKMLFDGLSQIPSKDGGLGDVIAGKIKDSRKLGFVSGVPGMDWLSEVPGFAKRALSQLRSLDKFTPAKQAINSWLSKRQRNSLEIQRDVGEIKRLVPKAVDREGITNWIQADGDVALLAQRAKATRKLSLKEGYEAALKLSPEALQVADKLRGYYQHKLTEAQGHGIVDQGVENYVNQIWDRPSVISKAGAEFAGKLTQNFKFAKERTFGSFFDGEQADMTPKTKDIAKLYAIYANELNKTIATRELIKDLTTKKASDGRPLASPVGSAAQALDDKGNESMMVRPTAKNEDTADYKTVANPALSKWKWVGSLDGKQVMLQGQLGLHPDIATHIENMLGRSAIKKWYDSPSDNIGSEIIKAMVKGADVAESTVKSTMLGGVSTFHATHEANRAAIGNHVSPFNLPDLNPSDPELKRALDSGLVVAGDSDANALFMEGLGGSRSLVDKLPLIGKVSKAVSDFTFHKFIPALKFKTWQALSERNTELFKGDIASGKVTQNEVDYLTSNQVNARFGHLNYADMGRNPTFRHVMSKLLLAPDFLEANVRNYGQSITGLVSKKGREPIKALMWTAATVYVASRILNKLVDDDYHFDEPFGVVHGNRVYTKRNEVEDLYRMFKNTRTYIAGRESPAVGSALDMLRGTNWRGEKQSTWDSFKDYLAKIIPISMRFLPAAHTMTDTGKNSRISSFQEFLGSQGIQVAGKSIINDAYGIAREYNKAQGVKEDSGVYPTSKYQHLRYSLEDENGDEAAKEVRKLIADEGAAKLVKGFHASLNHPFTGNKESDVKFMQSLEGKDKETVDKAVETRHKVQAAFTQIISKEAEAKK